MVFLKQSLKILTLTLMLLWVLNLSSFAGVSNKAADWYQWRGPNRDGISNEKGWSTTWQQDGPKRLWKIQVGKGFSAVSISNGRAYTMGNTNKIDTVYCLDANTGALVWKYQYHCTAEGGGYPGPGSTPTVNGKYVYTLSREGDFFCFDAKTGEVIWYKNVQKEFNAKPPSWQFTSSPIVLGKMVIVDVGITLALDKLTGKFMWKTEDYGGGYSSPYTFNPGKSQRVAVYNGFGLVILDPKTGKEMGKQAWELENKVNAATPIVSDNKAFISSSYDKGCALIDIGGDKPAIIWQNKNMRNHFNSCVLWQGNLYGFDESELKCMDFETSNVKWVQKGLGKSSLMIADGKLIIMTENGVLVIADAAPDSFKEIARAKILDGLCWTVPVLSNGKIYCRNHEGDLVCLNVKGQ